MAKRKRTKGQTTIYKTLHTKLKIVNNFRWWITCGSISL